MTKTQLTDSDVRGVQVNVCIDGVMSVFQSRMRDILDEHGIEKPAPHPDEWYPLSDFLEVLEVVELDVGENALTKIGEATPQFVDWPTSPTSPADALEHVVEIFEQNHRNVSGEYHFEQTGDSAGRITSTTPYPAAWEAGFLKGVAEVHGSEYARVKTVDDSDEEEIVFEIRWN